MGHATLILLTLTFIAVSTNAFYPSSFGILPRSHRNTFTTIRESENPTPETNTESVLSDSQISPTVDLPGGTAMDAAMKEQLEKQKKSDELRAQEVFIQKATGKHQCRNCDWQYDEEKGDIDIIGGQIQAGTVFDDLPSNWRCPTCRASKDSFDVISIEIPGFEVNQGYGFGGNSMSGDDKSGIIFGGLAIAAVLMLAGYGLS